MSIQYTSRGGAVEGREGGREGGKEGVPVGWYLRRTVDMPVRMLRSLLARHIKAAPMPREGGREKGRARGKESG